MRFKLILPALQTMTMLFIVWAPWAPDGHTLDVLLPNGRELKTWILIPGPDAAQWAEGVNLPAAAVVVPLEFAIRKNEALPNYKVKFWGFWMVGLACWHMVGRFADDLLHWRRHRVLPPRRSADMAFALIAVPSAVLLASVFIPHSSEVPALAAWGVVWVVVTGLALLFRVAQFFRETFRPPVS
jgi:hypothetical protein